MIFWLTGQPGSGKTTLAKKLIKSLTSKEKALKIIFQTNNGISYYSLIMEFQKDILKSRTLLKVIVQLMGVVVTHLPLLMNFATDINATKPPKM